MGSTQMSYRGYAARVEFDAEDGIFVGRVDGIRDVIGFHADNIDKMKATFDGAVDDYLNGLAAADAAEKVVGH